MVTVDLITGFLGAGKTTFIHKYLHYLQEQGENIRIIENEFGAVNVDTQMLEEEDCDILDLAANIGIVNKSGAWYAYNGDKIGQGRENAKQFFKDHPEIMEACESKVREYYGLQGAVAVDEPGQMNMTLGEE